MATDLTQEELKKFVSYDPETGVFTKISERNSGHIVGHKDYQGYLHVIVSGKSYRAHRLAWLYMTGAMPSGVIDHKNHDKADNRWDNLRMATLSQNAVNSRVMRTNKLGAKGVYMANNRYLACIMVNKKTIHLGRFDSVDEAAHAYNKAAIKHFGEFAVLNPVGI